MKTLPARSASRHWLSTGLALALAMGLAATCQAGMVLKTDPPDEQARPNSRPTSAPATMVAPAKSAAPAASRPRAPAAPAPATQGSNPARSKNAPPAADRPLARPGGQTGQTGQADKAGWPACIRQLNAAALSEHWDTERRQALLEQCP